MPRNEAKPLSKPGAMRAYKLRDALLGAQAEGIAVKLDYVKRDNTRSSSTGFVHGFSGQDGMDTMSVDVVTADKGIRTINLCRVAKAWPVRKVVTVMPIADQTVPEDN